MTSNTAPSSTINSYFSAADDSACSNTSAMLLLEQSKGTSDRVTPTPTSSACQSLSDVLNLVGITPTSAPVSKDESTFQTNGPVSPFQYDTLPKATIANALLPPVNSWTTSTVSHPSFAAISKASSFFPSHKLAVTSTNLDSGLGTLPSGGTTAYPIPSTLRNAGQTQAQSSASVSQSLDSLNHPHIATSQQLLSGVTWPQGSTVQSGSNTVQSQASLSTFIPSLGANQVIPSSSSSHPSLLPIGVSMPSSSLKMTLTSVSSNIKHPIPHTNTWRLTANLPSTSQVRKRPSVGSPNEDTTPSPPSKKVTTKGPENSAEAAALSITQSLVYEYHKIQMALQQQELQLRKILLQNNVKDMEQFKLQVLQLVQRRDQIIQAIKMAGTDPNIRSKLSQMAESSATQSSVSSKATVDQKHSSAANLQHSQIDTTASSSSSQNSLQPGGSMPPLSVPSVNPSFVAVSAAGTYALQSLTSSSISLKSSTTSADVPKQPFSQPITMATPSVTTTQAAVVDTKSLRGNTAAFPPFVLPNQSSLAYGLEGITNTANPSTVSAGTPRSDLQKISVSQSLAGSMQSLAFTQQQSDTVATFTAEQALMLLSNPNHQEGLSWERLQRLNSIRVQVLNDYQRRQLQAFVDSLPSNMIPRNIPELKQIMLERGFELQVPMYLSPKAIPRLNNISTQSSLSATASTSVSTSRTGSKLPQPTSASIQPIPSLLGSTSSGPSSSTTNRSNTNVKDSQSWYEATQKLKSIMAHIEQQQQQQQQQSYFNAANSFADRDTGKSPLASLSSSFSSASQGTAVEQLSSSSSYMTRAQSKAKQLAEIKAQQLKMRSGTSEEGRIALHMKTLLRRDHSLLDQGGDCQPFSSVVDAVERLLPYHVYYEEDVPEENEIISEKLFSKISTLLVAKQQGLMAKYHELLLRDMQKEVDPCMELCLLQEFVESESIRKSKEEPANELVQTEAVVGVTASIPSMPASQYYDPLLSWNSSSTWTQL